MSRWMKRDDGVVFPYCVHSMSEPGRFVEIVSPQDHTPVTGAVAEKVEVTTDTVRLPPWPGEENVTPGVAPGAVGLAPALEASPDLQLMTKAELEAFGREMYGLELDAKHLTKDQMLAAIADPGGATGGNRCGGQVPVG